MATRFDHASEESLDVSDGDLLPTTISEMDVDMLNECLNRNGTLLGLQEFIKKYAQWSCTGIYIAVSGQTGVGKSSLINAIRGLKNNEQGAAKVESVQVTHPPKCYYFPGTPKVKLCDMPGVGTIEYPATEETYQVLHMPMFDIVIIVSATRFMENDLWLLDRCLSDNKEVLFVRSKIDQDLQTEKEDFPTEYNETKCLLQIKKNIKDNMAKYLIQDLEIFLVSSRPRLQKKFDLPALRQKIADLLKGKARRIRKTLEKVIEEKIETDKEATNNGFWLSKACVGVCGFLPVPFLESFVSVEIVEKISSKCLKSGSLDEDSLQILATYLNISAVYLQTKLQAYQTIVDDSKAVRNDTEHVWPLPIRFAKYVVPAVGSVVSAAKAVIVIQECIETISRTIANDQRTVVELLLSKLEGDMRQLLI